jgi:hypothetical protein
MRLNRVEVSRQLVVVVVVVSWASDVEGVAGKTHTIGNPREGLSLAYPWVIAFPK